MLSYFEDRGFTRINSEAQAYQLIRHLLKKRRLRGKEIRKDKRCLDNMASLASIEVGAYYKIRRGCGEGTSYIVYGTHQFKYIVERARELLVSLEGGLAAAEQTDEYLKQYTDMSIEEKCTHYLLNYYSLGGDLTKAAMFGKITKGLTSYDKWRQENGSAEN